MLSPEQARIHAFHVVPALPEPLVPLMEIARNLWWTWNLQAVELFCRIDADLWSATGHNPVRFLGACPQARLEELAQDESYVGAIRRVYQELQDHLHRRLWFQKAHPDAVDCCIAYFSAEFGLSECLPIYSGGLGVLSGDHLKSASELGLPLVGVGLLYRNGYFQQYLNADGWQQEFYPDIDFTNIPVQPVQDESGNQLKVIIRLPGRMLHIAIWEATVGRVRLLLLDTNIPENHAEDRPITSQLYGGDMEMRIRQEIVLGIGGMRALCACGVRATVFHMNEGHAAFMALEHIRMLIEQHDCSFEEARQAAAASHLFTTHTPVPAGIDRFPPDMIQRYFREKVQDLRLDMETLLAHGRENVFNRNEFFSMAVLALRTSDQSNGVSKLHGKVSRDMWGSIWPAVPSEEVPIGRITNGIHTSSWLSGDLVWLFDRYLSIGWRSHSEDPALWEGLAQIPDEELWRSHERRRQKLVGWIRRTQRQQLERRGESSDDMRKVAELFDSRALTIGFARRFATYKRANLLFRDPERLMKILCNQDRPVQLVIAGKAHPADTQGKELIRQIVHFARENGAAERVVFIENYNIAVARYLVQGCDVWLNTPRRGLEASGTSGMKAAINGVLNCSILDGWWDEAWEHDAGWAIGRGEQYTNYDYQDQVESHLLYDLLEKQIVPMFYERDAAGLPRRWLAWMKTCIGTYAPQFNTNRMVREYTEQYYLTAHRRGRQLAADDLRQARELAGYVHHLHEHWRDVRVDHIEANTSTPLGVRQPLEVRAHVHLGQIEPRDVRVQCYYGPLDADGRIVGGGLVDMHHVEALPERRHRYAGQILPIHSGRHGFAVRAIPGHDLLASPFIPGLIAWDQQPRAARPAPELAVAAT